MKELISLLRIKNLILFLCISLSVQSQTKQSVFALDRMNLVYRGIENPISVAVNNAKSYRLYGIGIEQKQDGTYVLRPGIGLETKIFVEIIQQNNSVITEEHLVRIKKLPKPIGSLNEEFSTKGFLEFTKDDLRNAIIKIKFIDFNFGIDFKVDSFIIKYKKQEIKVEGNKIDENAFQFISKLKKGSEFIIDDISYPATEPLKIKPIRVWIK
ncbi:hypothetical protein E6C50_08260 [Flavobacterium supellecticarium]|uniref:Uncharacterized protein n=1 Tax=Flavobacterium supellecticarium TaxID=2565924 RepID=A0A4S4A0B7_9FLAO|nr:GldM family protein [Flavobacterium supellecticarium]THF51743.1 hypothetical protein E6C50_08260 [Flavobacterium supellecticarium]